MKYFVASAVLLAFLVSECSVQAAEKPYETGRIIEVEKRSHERILYYLVNTPVTRDDPYYQVSLQLNNFVYVAEYTPRHAADSLPDNWKSGTEVQMKFADKHHMWMKTPGGSELQLIILKRKPGIREMAAPKPASTQN